MVYTKQGEFICAVVVANHFYAVGLAMKFRISGFEVRWEYPDEKLN